MRVRHLLLNTIASSVFVPNAHRWRLLKILGLDVKKSEIEPRGFYGGVDIQIGEACYINWFVLLDNLAPISIGDHTLIGPRVTILTSTHSVLDDYSLGRAGPVRGLAVTIGRGCWLGANSTILPGIAVGDGCVVAAGSVVTADCEPNGFYAGVPATRRRELPPPVD
jgi:maltose O-acetyltransferase